MKAKISPVSRAVALVFAGVLASTPIWAEKGGHGGGGGDKHGQKHEKDDDRGERGHKFEKHERESPRVEHRRERDDRSERRHDREDRSERRHVAVAPHADVVHPHRTARFNPEHHTHVHQYYDEQFRAGHCPPGLAKKHNGCMPPGQAKKHPHWVTGQPLPAGVVTYPVPQPLLTQLGTPPAGYRYVRVGNDIVLLSSGTARVVDVIRNLGRG